MIARYNNQSLMLGIPGLILQVVGNVMSSNPERAGLGLGLAVLGTALLIAGLVMYAKAKERSPLWGLMGFLSLIGLIVLACLKDYAPEKPARSY